MKKIVSAVISFFVMTLTTAGAQSQTGERKILVAYFSMPETGGTDAVSGASRLIVGGKVIGNVQFAAECIQKAVGGDMFVIRTAQSYPTRISRFP
jgi:hypothetical protein